MEHAALALVQAIEERFGRAFLGCRGLIVSGTGNNGGDVLAAARILHLRGVQFSVVLIGLESKLSESALHQLKILQKLGVSTQTEISDGDLGESNWILDGIFGTGLSKPVQGAHLAAIEKINSVFSKWIVSADLPSGLMAGTGNVFGIAVKASHTVALGFLKRGLVTGEAKDYVGKLTLSPIQLPRALSIPVDTFLWDQEDASRILVRKPSGNKGTFGHVLVFLGEKEKEGASILSALGALRSGSGLVTIVGEKTRLESVRSRLLPEMMTGPLDLKETSGKVCVIGPGLGGGEEAWVKLHSVLKSENSLVIDADALTLISTHLKEARQLLKDRGEKKYITVLTPHPKEASRLLGMSVEEVQKDRYQSIRKLTETFFCACILKGSGTMAQIPGGPVFVVNRGNSSLAKGGTGDLLAGIMASFLGQGIAPAQAIPLAVFVHGRAAEILSQKIGEERTAFVTEIADSLLDVFRELKR